MAINYELINKEGISLSTNFDLFSEKPLDSRQVVPTLAGLQTLLDNGAAYEGMVVYVAEQKTHYKVQKTNEGTASYRELNLTEEELKSLIASETTGNFDNASEAIATEAAERQAAIEAERAAREAAINTAESNAKTYTEEEIIEAFNKFLSQETPPAGSNITTTLAQILADYATKQYVEDAVKFSIEDDILILD